VLPRHHRWRERATVLTLALLLLIPIGLSGHHHGRSETTHPCAACAVVQHAPMARTPVLVMLTVEFVRIVAVEENAIASPRSDRTPPSGRAPPRGSVTFVA